MPELKEVFELVSQKVEPDVNAWNGLEQRRGRSARIRKWGAIALAASLMIAVIVIGLGAVSDRRERTAVSPSVPADTGTDLYLLDPATGELRPTLTAPGPQTPGEVSPDGTRLVYEQRNEIFLRDSDGTTRQLTEIEGRASDPTWSPDGTEIAFVDGRPQGHSELVLMDADGSRSRTIASIPGRVEDPDWSPDGESLVFAVWPAGGGPADVSIVSVTDGEVTRLTSTPDDELAPAWSPDGRWIAIQRFVAGWRCCDRGEPITDIWLVHPDGSDEHRLLDDGFKKSAPAWSPDGRRIAFLSDFGNPPQVFVTDVDGNGWRALDGFTGYLTDLSWGPTGILLADGSDGSSA